MSDSNGNGAGAPSYGIHGMVWVEGWSNAEAERAISHAARIGYDVIEIPIQDPNIDTAHTKELLAAHGMQAAVAHALPADADISSDDPAVVARGADLLQRILATTVAIGGKTIAGVIASALRKYERPASDRNYENSAAVLRELAREAQVSGVSLCVEAINRYETNLMNTGAQVLRFVERIGEANVFVHLDTFHMNIEEPDCAAVIDLCGDRLGHFHVNESHRGYLGTGTIDLQPMFRALARIGYSRTLGFEAFSSSVASDELTGMVASWRDLWQDSDGIATHALAYMQREYGDAKRALGLNESS